MTSVFGAFLAGLLLLGPAFAGTAEVDARYHRIFDECLKPDFGDVECTYEPGETPLRTIPVLYTAAADIAEDVLFPMGRLIKETGWAASLLVRPDQPRYWQERAIGLNFEALETALAAKAKRESLKDCQRACLATCVSSKVIDYDDRKGLDSLKTAYGAIESEKGVCREFSAIGRDLMWRLGVKANVAAGFQEGAGGDGRYSSAGPHTMLSVYLDGRRYLMEPQRSSCVFYNSQFARVRRTDLASVKLEGTGKQADRERQPAGVDATTWTKWLDVTGLATIGVHEIESLATPAR